ncbi:UNVERIFIED_CONTAM: hypothetical protein Slati_3486900 [Sesamum latifolium]|uniref:DUF4283 domain-containing protein n=1 Tax=Sesamum latifolium TaxID=2727402 RepID=A0AAW2UK24_9LAMI
MAMRKHKHTQVPIWIKLKHLPMEFWIEEGLSTVASGVGKPLYLDAIIKACIGLDFTRVCVMLDISSKLPKHLVIMVPNKDGSETPCRVDVEYEWVPPKCFMCQNLGHSASKCSTIQQSTKPPVAIYVPRVKLPEQKDDKVMYSRPMKQKVSVEISEQPIVQMNIEEDGHDGVNDNPPLIEVPSDHKGKEIVLYNPFEVVLVMMKEVRVLYEVPFKAAPDYYT